MVLITGILATDAAAAEGHIIDIPTDQVAECDVYLLAPVAKQVGMLRYLMTYVSER
jgi:hypothetical protein